MKKLFTILIFCVVCILVSIEMHASQNLRAESSPLFSETFDTEDDFNNWTVVNRNGGVTWIYFNEMAAYLLDPDQQGDDWLISPSIQLEAGKVYKLVFEATIPTTSFKSESFRVTLGTSTNPESHLTVLADYPEYTSSDGIPIEIAVSVPESGAYHIGYQVYSQADMFRLMLDNVKVYDTNSSIFVPNSISNLTITPGNNGALSAVLSFDAPSKTYSGAELRKIESVLVYRNESELPVYTFQSPSVGESLSWTDNAATLGFNTYKIKAVNEHGEGPTQSISAYVGTDIPVAASNANIKIVEKSAEISWMPPTFGVNNGYINQELLKYRIVRNDGEVIANEITETRLKDNSLNFSEEQHSVYYTIYASSVVGEGEGVKTNQKTIGESLTLPFKESFEYAEYENESWNIDIIETDGGNSSPWLTDVEVIKPTGSPQDNDDGLIYFNSYWFSGSARLISPLIDINSVTNPKLTFWVFHYTPFGDEYDETNDRLQLEISKDNGDFIEIGDEIPVMKSEVNGWVKYEYYLYPYKDSEYIQISFKGISDFGYNIALDNIQITGASANDLAVSPLVGNKRINVAEENTYSVVVKNNGASKVNNYSVELYVDDKLFETTKGLALDPQSENELTFKYTAGLNDITEKDDTHLLTVKTVFAEDEIEDNNVAELNITVRKPNLPGVTELSGEWNQTDKQVNLTWSAPAKRISSAPETVIEGFESYEAFSMTDFGDWTLIDGDKSETYNFDGVIPTYKNKGKPMAFQIFNPGDLNLAEDWYFESNNGGSQYAICPSANVGPNNDWLISPLLSMDEQTISFYAKSLVEHYGMERLVFLYSTTDTHPDSFIKLSEGEHVKLPTFWKEYQYTVPVGARYFAIQCVSNESVIMFVDDITFSKANGDPESIELQGYNVYRDGLKINESVISSPEYSDIIDADGEYTYKITAVYDRGESAYSQSKVIDIDKTSIPMDELSNIKIYSVGGVLTIENIADKTVVINSIDGRIVYNNKTMDDKLAIALRQGVYTVKIEALTTKVIVR